MLIAHAFNDLLRIINAGGGMRLRTAPYDLNEILRFAAAAGTSGAQLTLVGLNQFDLNDLLRIASAGKGNVILEDD